MIISMKKGTPKVEVEKMAAYAESLGLHTQIIYGENQSIIGLIGGGGYYLYTDNIKSKVKSELLKEQILTNEKTNETKQELNVVKDEIISDMNNQKTIIAEKVKVAKQKIENSSEIDKPLSPVLKQTLIDIQSITRDE